MMQVHEAKEWLGITTQRAFLPLEPAFGQEAEEGWGMAGAA